MTSLRPGLPPLPARMAALKLDHRGFPVPWFVAWIDGAPDFRVVDTPKLVPAIKRRLCWLCGEPMGRFMAFVIGPMCAVNRVSSEPPSHRECAEFAAKACPFLTQPKMRRNEKDLPEERQEAAGYALKRNPGVTLIWITTDYRPFRAGGGEQGILIKIGEPTETLWFAEGRPATRAEVMASIDSGMPLLRAPAEEQSAEAVRELDRMYETALRLVPA